MGIDGVVEYECFSGTCFPSLAGVLTGVPILLDFGRTFELTMYVLPITIHALLQHLQRAGVLPKTENFSIVFFALCNMVIMRAYELKRNTIPSWMVSFLHILLR